MKYPFTIFKPTDINKSGILSSNLSKYFIQIKKYLLFLVIPLILFSSCVTRIVTSEPTTKVVVVKKTPRNYKVVRVKGKRYYIWSGKYHRKTRRGYVVVKL